MLSSPTVVKIQPNISDEHPGSWISSRDSLVYNDDDAGGNFANMCITRDKLGVYPSPLTGEIDVTAAMHGGGSSWWRRTLANIVFVSLLLSAFGRLCDGGQIECGQWLFR